MNLEWENIKKFNFKKKRGTYRQYNVLGSKKVIPRRTLYEWNRKKKEVISGALVSFFHGGDFQELVKISSNDKPCSERSPVDSDAVLDEIIHIEKEKVNEVLFDDIHPMEVEDLLVMSDREIIKNYDINIPQEFLIHNLVAMCIKWRRKTTYTIALDILKAMNSTTNNCCAPGESIYYFKKIVNCYSNPITSHYICIKCGNYLGSIHSKVQCDKCSRKIDENSKKSHFLYLSLEDQLVEIFETTDAHNSYSQTREKLSPYALEDIYDGKMYKKIHSNNTDVITINFSIDGLPIFASSNTSVYPVLCTVNEFDPVERRKRILLSSIWFGKGKPQDMNEYLKPFVSEAKKLYEQGFRYNYQGHQYLKKVIILMGICDAVARPIVRCSTQFNGRYGCGLCLHPGQEIAKGDGHARVYPLVGGEAFGEGLRNHQETLNQAKKHNKEDRKGIKRVSILTELHHFDIINCLDVDWMHCVALGVTRQFVNLWFDTANSSEDFYLRRDIDDMDAKFLSFQSTSEFSRTPRSLKDRAYFKAHEWVAFLLAYSLPLLISYFPKRYLKHWALLVDAISILVKNSIFKSEIVYAHECLLDFVAGVEKLYGIAQVTFNVHQLTHLAKSVENWGPLWTHSAFISEDYYQTLKAHVKSANGVVGQISDAFKLRCAIDRLAVECKSYLNDKQQEIIHDLLHGESKAQSHSYIDDVHILGNSIVVTTLSTRQCSALRRCDSKFDKNSTFLFHKRCIINNQVVTSKSYNREQKRANFNVLLNDDQIFEIHYYIGAKTNTRECNYAIGFYYELGDKPLIKNKRLNHLILLEKKIENLEAIETKNIVKKVMIFELKESANYVAYVHGCASELLI